MTDSYDAIVVGARCAGSPTAMLLARKGYRVLVVDRATFPSDTVVDALDPRAGRGRAAALGAPRPGDRDRLPARRHLLVRLRPVHDQPARRGRRRHRDRRTRRAARCSTRSSSTRPPRAGAEVREGFTVEEVVVEDGTVVGIRGHDAGRRVGRRAGPRRDRRRRPQLARRQGGRARAVQREADAAVELLHLLERPAGRRRSRPTIRPDRGWALPSRRTTV